MLTGDSAYKHTTRAYDFDCDCDRLSLTTARQKWTIAARARHSQPNLLPARPLEQCATRCATNEGRVQCSAAQHEVQWPPKPNNETPAAAAKGGAARQ